MKKTRNDKKTNKSQTTHTHTSKTDQKKRKEV